MKAIIEIPQGSSYKYEVDKNTGKLVLDRPLNQQVPSNYGYFPGTLSEDGDPADVFVMGWDPITPLTEVKVEIEGVVFCKDGGVQDDKILATISGDIAVPNSVKKHRKNEILNYLETYKKGFFVEGIGSKETAMEIYEKSVKNYKK